MFIFFPDPLFAWIFLGVLLALLGISCFTDLRRMVIPKWVTLPALFLGVALNVVRGVALAGQGLPTWILGANGPGVGGLDGLLFACVGFVTGFGLFFLMWLLGACGGGDVKLCAALGAWVGPYLMLFVMAATVVVVFLLVLGRVCIQVARGEARLAVRGPKRRALPPLPGKALHHPLPRALGLSVPLLLATTMVLLWEFRAGLRLAAAPAGTTAKVHSHAN